MKRIKLTLVLLLSILCIALLASCDSDDGDKPASGQTLTLNVYNWGEYISDGSLGSLDVNAAFEDYYYEKYGVKVKVNYSTYANNEDMYSKLKTAR